MGQGRFLLSFDCEAKWGMADCLTEHHREALTNEHLLDAYSQILGILETWKVKATFAFVAMLTLSADELDDNIALLDGYSENGERWLTAFRQSVLMKEYDGWCAPELLEMVRQSNNHEIAAHGLVHMPMAGHVEARRDFVLGQRGAGQVWRNKGIQPVTFAYPRNIAGFVDELEKYGFIGYRESHQKQRSMLKRLKGMCNEANMWQRAQEDGFIDNGVFCVPAGYFLNWRHGARRAIPARMTRRRWRHIIQDASNRGKVIHMWTHPHNFIDGGSQYRMLNDILEDVSDAIANGYLLNTTLGEYCREAMK